jgi:4-amino-4-deoxy-L-arabinose transferase-like glycosyltransferase
MKNNIFETVVMVSLVALAVLLLNPFDFWMPNMMVLGILVCALILFGVFATFILRENAGDERDEAHKALAGRNAFLAGSAVLLVGIVVQGYTHSVDPYLVGTLTVMIVAKIWTRMWSDRNR